MLFSGGLNRNENLNLFRVWFEVGIFIYLQREEEDEQ